MSAYEHMVFFRFKHQVAQVTLDDLMATLLAFPRTIPGILEMSAGINETEETENIHPNTQVVQKVHLRKCPGIAGLPTLLCSTGKACEPILIQRIDLRLLINTAGHNRALQMTCQAVERAQVIAALCPIWRCA